MAIPHGDDEVFPANGANTYGVVQDIEVDNNKGMVSAPAGPGLG
jgi:hypothetical protein